MVGIDGRAVGEVVQLLQAAERDAVADGDPQQGISRLDDVNN